MRKFGTVLLVMVMMTGLAGAVFANGTSEKAGPIKLGAVWPLGDITGKEMNNAAQLAVDEINAAGGVLGRQLQLTVIDSELKPAKGAAAIERLATVNNVDIFVAGLSSGVTLAQVPILKKYKKLTLWTGAASSTVEKAIGPDANWFFHLHPWDYEQGESYVKGWEAIAKKYPQVKLGKWFLAYENGPFGTSSFTASKELYKSLGSMTGESFKSAAAGGGDYTAVIEHAKQANPDVFIWAGYAPDALPIMQQAKAMNFAPPLFIGAPPGWPANFGTSPLSNDVVLYGMWAPSMSDVNPVSKHFYDAYVKKFNTSPETYFAPLAYSAIYILKNAIEKAGSLNEADLIKAMDATKYKSPLGQTITFGPSKIIQHQGIRGQKILQYQNGKQQVIWPFEYKTANLVYPFPGWNNR